MNTFQKVTLALVVAIAVAGIMIALDQITGWKLGLLVGWFPISAWFSTMSFMKYKEGYPINKTSWTNVLLGFFASLLIVVIGTLFKTPLILLGVIAGFIYNVVVYIEATIQKK